MFHTSRGLAAMLAAGIAVLTTLLCFLLLRTTADKLILIFLLSLAASFLLSIGVLQLFVFRDLDDIREWLKQFPGQEEEGEVKKTGPLSGVLAGLSAVVARKQAEIDELRKLEAFRKDFIADVSHELKTPIFAAQGFVHTLLDGAVEEKAVRKKFLKKAAKSLDGLDMLVQELMTLSHIETGQIKMRFEDFDILALTDEVFDQFKGKSNKKEVSLRIEGPMRKVMVYADRQRITQVLTNLISNAIKHSGEEGEVVVSFGVRKRSVVTRVRDFGEGIPKEHQDRIFERFYRVDKSRSREKGGTGLGLAIVKHILESHKTKPEVESEPGKGSTFAFKLPRAKAGGLQHEQQPELA